MAAPLTPDDRAITRETPFAPRPRTQPPPLRPRLDDDSILSGLSKQLTGEPNYKMDTKNPDPLIAGLLAHLPEPGSVWPEGDRTLWLSLMQGAFNLIYKVRRTDEVRNEDQEQPKRQSPGLTTDYSDERPPAPKVRSVEGPGNPLD